MVFIPYRRGGVMKEFAAHNEPEEIKMTECAAYGAHQPQPSGDAEYEPVTHQPQSRGDAEYELVTHQPQSNGDHDYEPVTDL